jgi:hypothetical protein
LTCTAAEGGAGEGGGGWDAANYFSSSQHGLTRAEGGAGERGAGGLQHVAEAWAKTVTTIVPVFVLVSASAGACLSRREQERTVTNRNMDVQYEGVRRELIAVVGAVQRMTGGGSGTQALQTAEGCIT